MVCVLLAGAVPASAGTWGTQAVLATNAYYGTVALDASGNMTSVWFQSSLPNGITVDEICASTAPFQAKLVRGSEHLRTDWQFTGESFGSHERFRQRQGRV